MVNGSQTWSMKVKVKVGQTYIRTNIAASWGPITTVNRYGDIGGYDKREISSKFLNDVTEKTVLSGGRYCIILGKSSICVS